MVRMREAVLAATLIGLYVLLSVPGCPGWTMTLGEDVALAMPVPPSWRALPNLRRKAPAFAVPEQERGCADYSPTVIGPFSEWLDCYQAPDEPERFHPPPLRPLTELTAVQGELVYVASGKLWRVELPAGKRRQLKREGTVWAPKWSGDGERLVIVSNHDGGRLRVVVTNATADQVEWEGPTLRGGGGGTVAPALSPDGRYLAYVAPGANYDEDDLVLVELATGEMDVVEHRSRVGRPTFSADGRYVAYRGGAFMKEDARVHDLETRTTRVLPSHGATDFEPPAWHPDGSLFVASSLGWCNSCLDTRIHVVDPIGLDRRRFVPGFSIYWGRGRVVVAPNGKRVAVDWYYRNGGFGAGHHSDITVREFDGTPVGDVGTSYPKPFYSFYAPTWAPDSRHLAAAMFVCPYMGCDLRVQSIVVVDTTAARFRPAFVAHGHAPAWRPPLPGGQRP